MGREWKGGGGEEGERKGEGVEGGKGKGKSREISLIK